MRLSSHLIVATATGVCAVVLFATAHALLIVPIWSRLLSGFPFALMTAVALGWTRTELLRSSRLGLRLRDGALFGFALWALLLPPTLVGVVTRLTGLHAQAEPLEMTAEVLAGCAGAGLVGWRVAGRRGAMSLAATLLALILAMGGPIPITNGHRAIAIWLAFVPILVVVGVLQTLFLQVLARGAA